jgi:hypothetical protein
MRAGRGARGGGASGRPSHSSGDTPGSTGTPAARPIPWAGSGRTRGASTTCTGTCGSGARTGGTAATTRPAVRTTAGRGPRGRPRIRVSRGGCWYIHRPRLPVRVPDQARPRLPVGRPGLPPRRVVGALEHPGPRALGERAHPGGSRRASEAAGRDPSRLRGGCRRERNRTRRLPGRASRRRPRPPRARRASEACEPARAAAEQGVSGPVRGGCGGRHRAGPALPCRSGGTAPTSAPPDRSTPGITPFLPSRPGVARLSGDTPPR